MVTPDSAVTLLAAGLGGRVLEEGERKEGEVWRRYSTREGERIQRKGTAEIGRGKEKRKTWDEFGGTKRRERRRVGKKKGRKRGGERGRQKGE